MKRYSIKPVDSRIHAEAWANTLQKAHEIKAKLRIATGKRWRIIKQIKGYDNSV